MSTPHLAYFTSSGFRDDEVDGTTVKTVLQGNSSPRLFVSASNLTKVVIHYLDDGWGKLRANVHNAYDDSWIYEYVVISKTNSYTWKSFEFLVPLDLTKRFVELGLHADGGDFHIKRLDAGPLQVAGYTSLNRLNGEVTNTTVPSTLRVCLPLLRANETVSVQTASLGMNLSIEVFRGMIQPSETMSWWLNHEMVARSPQLPKLGQVNPSLSWTIDNAGLYTLVIVLWNDCSMGKDIDVKIVIGG
jgi:hypothetical protein